MPTEIEPGAWLIDHNIGRDYNSFEIQLNNYNVRTLLRSTSLPAAWAKKEERTERVERHRKRWRSADRYATSETTRLRNGRIRLLLNRLNALERPPGQFHVT